ncbi:AraC family transcriptional regulator [Cellulosilyticum sp. I15G10I2]|uniref:AraC family transcriptional regulator n=1 Tax=Cellulosilyticum sp. I15G10I2 TaxID=1892843 RepID=UPI00085BFBEF|nr:helix-turn-helix domain-containing protein [Cellulosilyticum sp. I15G10I2]
MESWGCIEKVIDYIEKNLDKEITIDCLADRANLSPFYFQKLFKRLVNKTAIEYVKLRRLAKISEELKTNKKDNIIDICLKYGFENHETFSRCFKDAYGLTPSAYRANPILLSHFLKPEIGLQYNIIDEDVPIVTDGIVLEVTRKFLNKPKYFAGYTVEVVHEPPSIDPLEDIWNKVHATKVSIEKYIPEGNEIGISLNIGEGEALKYFAGVETSEAIKDSRLENYTLTARGYIVCKFEAESFYTLITETIYKVYQYMHLWILKKAINVEHLAIELYYGTSPDRTYMELWIPITQ